MGLHTSYVYVHTHTLYWTDYEVASVGVHVPYVTYARSLYVVQL